MNNKKYNQLPKLESMPAIPHWSQPSYLARLQHLHALSVGAVAEALARTCQTGYANR